jgi:hypothetical protein
MRVVRCREARLRAPASASSSAGSPPRRVSGGASRRISCATPTPSSSPAKACRSTSFSASSGTPTSARPASNTGHRHRRDHRHYPRPAGPPSAVPPSLAVATASHSESGRHDGPPSMAGHASCLSNPGARTAHVALISRSRRPILSSEIAGPGRRRHSRRRMKSAQTSVELPPSPSTGAASTGAC